MIVGIVGAEAAKFTALGERRAKAKIRQLIINPAVTGVASGRCHLGGVDIWAEEIAAAVGKRFLAFPPRVLAWEDGYKPRNIQIAMASDEVWCLAVNRLPDNFNGMIHDGCYHCMKSGADIYPEHVKSGGCWTMHWARKHGKVGRLYVVNNF